MLSPYDGESIESLQIRPQAPATGMLTLLTRAYCHLCDEMRLAAAPVASRNGVMLLEVDVDADSQLEEHYGDRVPVLLLGPPFDGIELCHYEFDETAVDCALKNAS